MAAKITDRAVKVAEGMIYTYDAISLWLRGYISWSSLQLVLRTRQAAVCGKGGAYLICRKTARDLV